MMNNHPQTAIQWHNPKLFLAETWQKHYICAKNKSYMRLIGREEECRELRRLYESGSPEFVAIYGRRRVGKTFLVKEFFRNKFTFYTSGLARCGLKDQLRNFHESLIQYGLPKDSGRPSDWFEAFDLLKDVIERDRSRRKIVFIDELPWLDTQKSKFIPALDRFWNSWASGRSEIMLIVCGSAASWMVRNIIKNRGGLHNRITSKISLMPFSLSETRDFLKSKGISWNIKAIAETYMILGGVPYYLALLDKNRSLHQNIDELFFKENAKLDDEFRNLYDSLFRKSAEHIKIVELLARKKSGYSRTEIKEGLKYKDGGSLTRKLDELEHCGFIRKYTSLGSSRNIYQLVDFFTLFYFQFVRTKSKLDNFSWSGMVGTHTYSTWTGLAFERLCFSQMSRIRAALGIGSVICRTYPFYDGRMQLDMVIERQDKSVSLCEMKWSEGKYSLTTSDKAKLADRKETLRNLYKDRSIFIVFITTSGVVENDYTKENINDILTLTSLL